MTLIQIVNMNERILELMKQADYPAPELALRAHKLAELIVRECATLVDAAFDIDEHSGEVVSYADGGQLKEHFGVKE
jgi:hypothetical protein